VLALLGLVLAASASVSALDTTLESSLPWWERIAVTVDGKGKQQSCTFQSSLEPTGPKTCEPSVASNMQVAGTGGPQGSYSKITFERRFSPAAQLDSGRLQPGDTLLARQVLFLTIGADGLIDGCKVIATGGDMALAYGCDEARTEQFRAAADQDQSPVARQAFLTILAYRHEEQIA
jgi:hypothetical protein